MTVAQTYVSPLGTMTLAADGDALTGLWFDGQRYDRSTLASDVGVGECAALTDAVAWLDAYFAGGSPIHMPSVRLVGTPFQLAVWELLRAIPPGRTTTYGALARVLEGRLGRRVSPRSVGGAVGRNPVSVIVACHRVVAATGALTGYAGGVARKVALLRLEGVEIDDERLCVIGREALMDASDLQQLFASHLVAALW